VGRLSASPFKAFDFSCGFVLANSGSKKVQVQNTLCAIFQRILGGMARFERLLCLLCSAPVMVLLSNYRSHVAARFESKGYGRHFVECFLFGLGWRQWRGLLTIIFVRDKIKVLAGLGSGVVVRARHGSRSL
jgi:hypothetical protein